MSKDQNNPRRGRGPRENKEFNQKILDLARVTRVVAGGKRMRFRASVVIGDGKGRVGFAVRKGADVSSAINKAATAARKHLITVPIVNDSIPHEARSKFGAAKILIKPAVKGSGVIAGSATRIVMELAGVKNVVAKSMGSNNKLNAARATLVALQQLRKVNPIHSDTK